MQEFKIKHFEREHPGEQFPSTRLFDTTDSTELLSNLAQKIAGLHSIQDLVRFLNTNSQVLNSLNAESEQFDLSSVLQALALAPQRDVFLLWLYNPPGIEQIEYRALVEYFDYIWYPSSDDTAIFDSTFSWILVITHEGEVRFIKHNRPQ